MRSVEEQQALVSAAAVAPRPVRVAIAEAQGLMCAEEVVAEHPMPGFDQAAIDGYAVRSVDVAGAAAIDERGDPNGPGDGGAVSLPVLGTIEAGARTPTRLQPRLATRIQTGAPMPTLADAVLPLRWTDGGQSRVRVLRGVRSGAYVRHTGDDVRPGDVAVRAGTIVGAAQVGLLAAVGRERVLVHPRPRLSVISVGGELVDVSRTPGNGQVYDVNSYALAAAARDAGAEVNRIGIVSSDPAKLGEVVEGQLNRAEVVVIAGGVGGAAAEEVRNVLGKLGGSARLDGGAAKLGPPYELGGSARLDGGAAKLGPPYEPGGLARLDGGEAKLGPPYEPGGLARLDGGEAKLGPPYEPRDMEVSRIAMHPGSVQGFGQLGSEGVPTFLLPANPVSALVVFEVMVRPLIRLSLGKREPMRRMVQARAVAPISSVRGRKGYLRGQLMRDSDTDEYLVQALGVGSGTSSHLLATLAEANCLVVVPEEVEQIGVGDTVDVAFLAQRG